MLTVLVVEDNAANMTLATFLLESAGHTVLSAVDADRRCLSRSANLHASRPSPGIGDR